MLSFILPIHHANLSKNVPSILPLWFTSIKIFFLRNFENYENNKHQLFNVESYIETGMSTEVMFYHTSSLHINRYFHLPHLQRTSLNWV